MSEYLKISEEIRALGAEAEREIRPYFSRIEEICDRNTEKVLAAFAKNRVSDNLFAGTTGYGYDDYGRDTLDKIYADIFGTEAALVRIGFVNGTHATVLPPCSPAVSDRGRRFCRPPAAAYDTLAEYGGRPAGHGGGSLCRATASATGQVRPEGGAVPTCPRSVKAARRRKR